MQRVVVAIPPHVAGGEYRHVRAWSGIGPLCGWEHPSDSGIPTTMPLFESDREKRVALASAWVVPEPSRCVQCGICSFRCPVEIDVRRHVWQREPVKDSRCLTCAQCVDNCPRGLLRLVPVGRTRLTSIDPMVD